MDVASQTNPVGIPTLPEGPQPYNTNRRFMPRLRSPFLVKITGEESHYQGIDISFGGLMASGKKNLPQGSVNELRLLLPGENTTTTLNARVVQLVRFRGKMAMRMRFINPSLELRSKIAGWMGRFR